MPADGVVTDFSQYTLAQLNQMLDQSNPASCQSAAQTWDSTGNLLHEQVHNLESRLLAVASGWSGTASAEYKQMIADLIGGIRKVADTAFQMRDVTYEATDALNAARAEMPPPVDVPSVSAATVALATTPVRVGANTPPQVIGQLQQQQAAAVQAVQQQQQAVAAAGTAQAKAVAVMQTLAGSYVAAQQAIPPSPASAVPTLPGSAQSAVTAGVFAPLTQPGATGSVLAGAAQSGIATDGHPSALFGNMFTVGLAAAAAAAVGRFGSLMPSVPGFAKAQPNRKDNAQGTGSAARLGAGGAAAAPAPTAGPGMGGADPGVAANLAGSAAAGAAVSGIGGGAPMMPMMPMSGMARAGMGGFGSTGGSRRNPPWIVGTQEVWGESLPAAPGLISD